MAEKLKMLNVFRENLKHLKWVLLLVVASFILTIFAVWGGGVGNRGSQLDNAVWAARVNGAVISVQAFQREARNLEATYRQILGAQYDQQRAFIKLGRMAIDSLVDRELLAREARKAGLRVSGQEVAEAIMKEPTFQQNGAFIGRERYEKLFHANQASLEQYEEEVKQGLLLSKLRSLIQDSVSVSDTEVSEAYVRQNEKVTAQYLLFDPGRMPPFTPTDPMVEDFYHRHIADYLSGEGRSGRYVLFDSRDIASRIDVPESDVRSEYLQNLKTLFTVPEKRRASHILIKIPQGASAEQVRAAEDKIQKALARIRGGEDFAKVAREVSEDSSAGAGGDLNYFTEDQMVREFAAAAWSLHVGQVSGLVRSPFGFHIIRLTDIQAGKEMALEEARPQILARLKAARAQAETRQRAEEFVRKLRKQGGDLEEAAKVTGVVVKTFAAVHPGEEVPGLGPQQALQERLFALKPGNVADPIPVSSGQAVLQFLSTAPSQPLPLEKVRDRVSRDLVQDSRIQSVSKMLATAGGTSDLPATARKLKMDLKNTGPVARSGSLPDLGSDLGFMTWLFALKTGEIVGPLATPNGVAVIRLASRSDPMEGFDSKKESLRSSLLTAKRGRFFRAYLERLHAANQIVINTPLVEQADRT